eukprot:Awhi_evm1s1266
MKLKPQILEENYLILNCNDGNQIKRGFVTNTISTFMTNVDSKLAITSTSLRHSFACILMNRFDMGLIPKITCRNEMLNSLADWMGTSKTMLTNVYLATNTRGDTRLMLSNNSVVRRKMRDLTTNKFGVDIVSDNDTEENMSSEEDI